MPAPPQPLRSVPAVATVPVLAPQHHAVPAVPHHHAVPAVPAVTAVRPAQPAISSLPAVLVRSPKSAGGGEVLKAAQEDQI